MDVPLMLTKYPSLAEQVMLIGHTNEQPLIEFFSRTIERFAQIVECIRLDGFIENRESS